MQGQSAEQTAMIVTDGVFSMDGDYAPFRIIICVGRTAVYLFDGGRCAWFRCVWAQLGLDWLEQYQLNQQQVPVLVGTLGKAFGTSWCICCRL